MQSEMVLCLKREDLPVNWVMPETALSLSLTARQELLANTPIYWQSRQTVETDAGYKQLVPYVVLQDPSGARTAAYQRQGSETRLHGLWSIGIGGHINPSDRLSAPETLEMLLENGMRRELQEELDCAAGNFDLTFLGIINEDRTAVGSVHLGLVHRLCLDPAVMQQAGAELTRFTWRPTGSLAQLPLELWSQLALRLL